MSDRLRSALLDLVWASDLNRLRAEYSIHEVENYTEAERETLAIVFNQLIHVFQVEANKSAAAAAP